MTILAVVATGISIFGVVLIRRTFEETKRTADAAFQAVGTERAWMTFAKFDCGPVPSQHTNDPSAGLDAFGYMIIWANNGRSPAIKVTCQNTFTLRPHDGTVPQFPVLPPDGAPNLPVGPSDFLTSQLVPLSVAEARRYLSGQARLIIFSRVEYFDVFSPTIRVSEICSEVISTPQVDSSDGVVRGRFMLRPVGDQSSVS